MSNCLQSPEDMSALPLIDASSVNKGRLHFANSLLPPFEGERITIPKESHSVRDFALHFEIQRSGGTQYLLV